MPIAASTMGPQQVTLAAGVAKSIVPANPQRNGLILCNGLTVGNIYIALGPVDPSAQVYTWRLDPGEDWALPTYGAWQEVRAFCGTAVSLGGAGLCYTEFFVP